MNSYQLIRNWTFRQIFDFSTDGYWAEQDHVDLLDPSLFKVDEKEDLLFYTS